MVDFTLIILNPLCTLILCFAHFEILTFWFFQDEDDFPTDPPHDSEVQLGYVGWMMCLKVEQNLNCGVLIFILSCCLNGRDLVTRGSNQWTEVVELQVL